MIAEHTHTEQFHEIDVFNIKQKYSWLYLYMLDKMKQEWRGEKQSVCTTKGIKMMTTTQIKYIENDESKLRSIKSIYK